MITWAGFSESEWENFTEWEEFIFTASEATFRLPAFGSTHAVHTHTLTRTLPDGDLRQSRPTWWPANDIFNWRFTGLTYTQKETLKNFLCDNLGQRVDFIDELGRRWRGWVISREVVFTQTHRDTEECANNGLYSTSFEFDAELIE